MYALPCRAEGGRTVYCPSLLKLARRYGDVASKRRKALVTETLRLLQKPQRFAYKLACGEVPAGLYFFMNKLFLMLGEGYIGHMHI